MFQPPLLLPAHADLPVSAAVLVVLLPAHAAPAIPPVPAVLLATSSGSSRSRHMLQPLFLLPAHADLPAPAAVLVVLLPAHADLPVSAAVLAVPATGPRSSCYSFCYSCSSCYCYCYCYCATALLLLLLLLLLFLLPLLLRQDSFAC